jgi:hypothetical protein
MPGMDGLEFAIRMRADGRFRVAVTGEPGQPVLMATWIAGFDGQIDTPDHSRAACPGDILARLRHDDRNGPDSIKPLVRTPGLERAYFLHQASAPGRALG